ncbi:uncharacterized protein LOC134855512 [Symsagittifera roscoffensis]|uniref:uncharacterized protein LOC134855512 n=1 Tax=Symsagittifera roscoffensis TaxID=84072 RepID=UPI00307C9DED
MRTKTAEQVEQFLSEARIKFRLDDLLDKEKLERYASGLSCASFISSVGNSNVQLIDSNLANNATADPSGINQQPSSVARQNSPPPPYDFSVRNGSSLTVNGYHTSGHNWTEVAETDYLTHAEDYSGETGSGISSYAPSNNEEENESKINYWLLVACCIGVTLSVVVILLLVERKIKASRSKASSGETLPGLHVYCSGASKSVDIADENKLNSANFNATTLPPDEYHSGPITDDREDLIPEDGQIN